MNYVFVALFIIATKILENIFFPDAGWAPQVAFARGLVAGILTAWAIGPIKVILK